MTELSILKGWFFVITTGIMLYFLIDRSIKKLKQSEEELLRKDEMYRLVISGTTDGLWDYDIENNTLYFSSHLNQEIDFEASNILNPMDFWRKLIHPDDINVVYTEMKDYTDKKINKFCCECRIKIKDTDYVWAQVKGQGIWDDNGKILRIIGTQTDITKRKIVEEKLKQANDENVRLLNEAIEYDKLKTEFFTNISHEFRTPLNVILGSVQLIESYKDINNSHEFNGKLFKNISIMRQNCYRLLKIINNLIDITKIDSGFFDIHYQNCNIVDVIERVTLSVAEFIESKSITLTFDTDTEEKIMSCDINKIERIILNLLSNATKFNKPDGSIFVELHDIEDGIIVSVKDTGIGIPENKKEEIFERFRQVNSSLTKETEGSGIGLSIVKSLVEMHGGEISVNTSFGEYTEFLIRLPANLQPSDIEVSIEDTMSRKYLYMASVEFSDIYT
ncbi:MAG: PAS domain-containing sensor histidine kinase [Bacillota bacterium]|nr:PAS domain-containing sensor histidine kinase [Bacillota bacterium]